MSKINTWKINSFEENSFYIKFYPGIKSSLGCEKATLILGRLEYWFSKKRNGFYKFIEPCKHPLYKEGDSWAEEIGFPRKVFAKAFDLIGIRYKSKSDFVHSEDKFQGKLYASYHDRKTNKTYFVRNHEFASQFIQGLFHQKFSPKTSSVKPESKPQRVSDSAVGFSKKGRSRSGQSGRSYKDPFIQKNTSSLEAAQKESSILDISPSQKKGTEEMIKIWKEEIGELGVPSLSINLLSRLAEALQHFFDQSLDQWQSYCRMISSSKFLMGEAQNKFFKKAWITWAITKEAIERVRGGGFTLGDRQTNTDKAVEEIDKEIQMLRNQEDKIKETFQEIKKSTRRERDKQTKESIENLSERELTKYRKDYEKYLENKNDSLFEEYKRKGWEGAFVETCFSIFLEEKLEAKLFDCSLESQSDKIIAELSLPQALQKVASQIEALKQKRKDIREISLDAAITTEIPLLIRKEQTAYRS